MDENGFTREMIIHALRYITINRLDIVSSFTNVIPIGSIITSYKTSRVYLYRLIDVLDLGRVSPHRPGCIASSKGNKCSQWDTIDMLLKCQGGVTELFWFRCDIQVQWWCLDRRSYKNILFSCMNSIFLYEIHDWLKQYWLLSNF